MNATFGMTLIVLVFSMSAVLKCGEGNVLHLDKSLSGILLSSDHDEEWNTVEIDNKNTVKAFNSHLDLDKSSNLRLKDAKTYDIGRLYNFHQRTYVYFIFLLFLFMNLYIILSFRLILFISLFYNSNYVLQLILC
jgi:hypothetical protein